VATRPKDKGRIAIVTNAGRAAVGADRTGAKGFCRAGNREQSRRAHDRCDRRTAKSCGPDARGSGVKSCGDAAAQPGSQHQSSARRRGNSATLPRRVRHKPFQPLRREGRDVSGCPVLRYAAAHAVCPWHSGPREPTGSRPSLRPCSIEGKATKQSSGEMSREDAKPCLRAPCEYRMLPHCIVSDRHPEAAASSAALEGRQPGCTSPAAHPSRLRMRCIRIARLAPQDDGTDSVGAERLWIAFAFAKRLRRTSRCARNDGVETVRVQTMVSCPGRSAAPSSAVRCRAGAHVAANARRLGSRLCAAAQERCSASGTRDRAPSPALLQMLQAL